jgi:hypothetical protein
MTLVDVVDGAYLQPLSNLSSKFKAAAGYVSGPSAYHIWPTGDAQKVRDSGREFWAIDVPNQTAMNSTTGINAANRMIDKLPLYHHNVNCPVFMDVEYNAYMADPSGANAAVSAFKNRMKTVGGYTRPYGYLPSIAGYDWIARYRTGPAPTFLPAGVIGHQYANEAITGDGWDHSVFDPSLFGAVNPDPIPVPVPPEDFMSFITNQAEFNAAMKEFFTAAAGTPDMGLRLALDSYFSTRIPDADHPTPGSISERLGNRLDAILGDPQDPTSLYRKIVDNLGA